MSAPRLLAWLRAHEADAIDLIGGMVERESPSDSPEALTAWAAWFTCGIAPRFGLSVKHHPGGHLECSTAPESRTKPVLVLGHYDTVWPIGTLDRMPFLHDGDLLRGPGVLDMKGGVGLFLMALGALTALDIPLPAPVKLLLNADEEVGSKTSRPLTEALAQEALAVLVVEPGTGPTGKLKTARKGIGDYRLTVRGRASHSGVDFEAGASAVVELCHQLLRIAGFTDPERGITLNPGVIQGGTRSNVVAAEAHAHIDARVAMLEDAEPLDRRLRDLEPVDPRCSLQVEGGWNRPPLERTPGVVALFRLARTIAEELGIQLEESSTGGGSDGNFTAALGVPTLDGLGAVGEGAHADHEHLRVDRLSDRAALLALLLTRVPIA